MELRSRRRGAATGFSLLEVLVSVGLLLTIFVGILPLFTRSIVNNQIGNESSRISNFGRTQMETLTQFNFDDPALTIDNGSSKVIPEHYSHVKQEWVAGHTPGTDDTALWLRTLTVRQFHVSALADGELEESEALPAGSLPEYVNLKQITVDLENQGGNSVARPRQEMTVQLFRSQ